MELFVLIYYIANHSFRKRQKGNVCEIVALWFYLHKTYMKKRNFIVFTAKQINDIIIESMISTLFKESERDYSE